MSFSTGLSGLAAANKDLQVTGNNVANASTTGFKASRTEFGDAYTASILGSGRSNIGGGVNVANIGQKMTQGNIRQTGSVLDMAIDGSGFFVTKYDNGQTTYTRSGIFGINKEGYIVNNQNAKLQGFVASPTGIMDGILRDMRVDTTSQPPRGTSRVEAGVNVPAGAPVLAQLGSITRTNGLAIGQVQAGSATPTASVLNTVNPPRTAGTAAALLASFNLADRYTGTDTVPTTDVFMSGVTRVLNALEGDNPTAAFPVNNLVDSIALNINQPNGTLANIVIGPLNDVANNMGELISEFQEAINATELNGRVLVRESTANPGQLELYSVDGTTLNSVADVGAGTLAVSLGLNATTVLNPRLLLDDANGSEVLEFVAERINTGTSVNSSLAIPAGTNFQTQADLITYLQTELDNIFGAGEIRVIADPAGTGRIEFTSNPNSNTRLLNVRDVAGSLSTALRLNVTQDASASQRVFQDAPVGTDAVVIQFRDPALNNGQLTSVQVRPFPSGGNFADINELIERFQTSINNDPLLGGRVIIQEDPNNAGTLQLLSSTGLQIQSVTDLASNTVAIADVLNLTAGEINPAIWNRLPPNSPETIDISVQGPNIDGGAVRTVTLEPFPVGTEINNLSQLLSTFQRSIDSNPQLAGLIRVEAAYEELSLTPTNPGGSITIETSATFTTGNMQVAANTLVNATNRNFEISVNGSAFGLLQLDSNFTPIGGVQGVYNDVGQLAEFINDAVQNGAANSNFRDADGNPLFSATGNLTTGRLTFSSSLGGPDSAIVARTGGGNILIRNDVTTTTSQTGGSFQRSQLNIIFDGTNEVPGGDLQLNLAGVATTATLTIPGGPFSDPAVLAAAINTQITGSAIDGQVEATVSGDGNSIIFQSNDSNVTGIAIGGATTITGSFVQRYSQHLNNGDVIITDMAFAAGINGANDILGISVDNGPLLDLDLNPALYPAYTGATPPANAAQLAQLIQSAANASLAGSGITSSSVGDQVVISSNSGGSVVLGNAAIPAQTVGNGPANLSITGLAAITVSDTSGTLTTGTFLVNDNGEFVVSSPSPEFDSALNPMVIRSGFNDTFSMRLEVNGGGFTTYTVTLPNDLVINSMAELAAAINTALATADLAGVPTNLAGANGVVASVSAGGNALVLTTEQAGAGNRIEVTNGRFPITGGAVSGALAESEQVDITPVDPGPGRIRLVADGPFASDGTAIVGINNNVGDVGTVMGLDVTGVNAPLITSPIAGVDLFANGGSIDLTSIEGTPVRVIGNEVTTTLFNGLVTGQPTVLTGSKNLNFSTPIGQGGDELRFVLQTGGFADTISVVAPGGGFTSANQLLNAINAQINGSALLQGRLAAEIDSSNRVRFVNSNNAATGISVNDSGSTSADFSAGFFGLTPTSIPVPNLAVGVADIPANNQFNITVAGASPGTGTLVLPPRDYDDANAVADALNQQIMANVDLIGKVQVEAINNRIVFSLTTTGGLPNALDVTGSPNALAAIGHTVQNRPDPVNSVDRRTSFRINLAVPLPDPDNRSGSVVIELNENIRTIEQLAQAINRQLAAVPEQEYIAVRADVVVNANGSKQLAFSAIQDGEASQVSISDVRAMGNDVTLEEINALLQVDRSDSSLLTLGRPGISNGYPEQTFVLTDASGETRTVFLEANLPASAIASRLSALPGVQASASTTLTFRSEDYVNGGDMNFIINGQIIRANSYAAMVDEINQYQQTTLQGITAALSSTGDLVLRSQSGSDIQVDIQSPRTADRVTLVGGSNTAPLTLGGVADAPTAAMVGGSVEIILNRGYAMSNPQPRVTGLFTGLTANDFRDYVINEFDPLNPETYNETASMTIYDSLGNQHVLQLFFVKDQDDPNRPFDLNSWTVYSQIDGRDVGDPDLSLPFPQNQEPTRTSYKMFFNADGTLNREASGSWLVSNWLPRSADGNATGAYGPLTNAQGGRLPIVQPNQSSNFEINFGNVSQYGSAFSRENFSQDGYASGQLQDLEIDDQGTVFARFTSGQTQAIGQVAIASFRNPEGLTAVGFTEWVESFDSGNVTIGQPGTGVLGKIRSAALEDSNVDLSEQLVNLIIAQRNFQASAKTIETASAITQTIINLR